MSDNTGIRRPSPHGGHCLADSIAGAWGRKQLPLRA